jgi:beta-glucosidase
MNLSEKVVMLHGQRGVSHVGHASNYTGLILGNKRLGIPAIQMEDGPQGFRCGKMPCAPGSSTAWPSGLTIAATWDTALALQWGEAMGAEFRGKGANVQLGPGMCIARVPTNGRNFEYLSGMRRYASSPTACIQAFLSCFLPDTKMVPGEDPVLGAQMVAPVIKGIQSKGVIANAKHFVMNNQEVNRHDVVEEVDERTMFEIYYPPFKAAVDAGVGSVMVGVDLIKILTCSYNKIFFLWW